jgi:hypothetical protein
LLFCKKERRIFLRSHLFDILELVYFELKRIH